MAKNEPIKLPDYQRQDQWDTIPPGIPAKKVAPTAKRHANERQASFRGGRFHVGLVRRG